MNSCLKSRLGLFVGHAALSLLVGCASQQHDGGKSKSDIPQAGLDGVSMPTCEYCPDPEYSQEAGKKKYEGVVVLMVVVTTEGEATDIRVINGPGLGFDEKAIEAVRTWRFKPAKKDGVPVAAHVPIEVSFGRSQDAPVSLIELIANPEKYDGKQVFVVGFLRLEFEGINALYLHEDDYKNNIYGNAIGIIGPKIWKWPKDKVNMHYVRLKGTFRAGKSYLHTGVIVDVTDVTAWPLGLTHH